MPRTTVLVTDRQILPATSGNRVRILQLLRCLRACGWRVAVVVSAACCVEALRGEVDEVLAVNAPSFPGGSPKAFDVRPYRRVLESAASRLGPSLVVAEYAWMAPAMARLPRRVLRAVDCHDLLYERTERFRKAGLDPWVDCTRDEESALLGCADLLIASQERDEEQLRRLAPGKRVFCLLPSFDLPDGYQPVAPERDIVLAVGAQHAGNEGIREFAAIHWPRVLERAPAARLEIVGTMGAWVAAGPGIDVRGAVDDLASCYARAAVVVCPVAAGTGVKVKLLEALRFGKPVVATAAAAEGLPAPEEAAWVRAGSLAECADAVVDLLADRAARDEIASRAFSYGRRHLSREASMAQLHSQLPGWFGMALRRLAYA